MDPVNVSDYEALAQLRLDPATWAYVSGGVADEITLRGNREAFARIRLRPRVLRDVSTADLRTRILGTDLSIRMPILVAPTAVQGEACAEGKCAPAPAG